jgi:hypothetical protein
MKSKKKICDECGERKHIWKNVFKNGERKRFCKYCWSAQHKGFKPTASKSIRSRSPRKTTGDILYSKKAKAFKELYPMCQAGIPGFCTKQTHDVHHKAGRIGDMLLKEEYWLAVCRSCHDWIETHPIESRELGYSISKTK